MGKCGESREMKGKAQQSAIPKKIRGLAAFSRHCQSPSERILSPLCLPFHHPGDVNKLSTYGLSYSYIFHQILRYFSYQLVIDWSLSRGKYTLPAERSEERSCCYCARPLAVGLSPFELCAYTRIQTKLRFQYVLDYSVPEGVSWEQWQRLLELPAQSAAPGQTSQRTSDPRYNLPDVKDDLTRR